MTARKFNPDCVSCRRERREARKRKDATPSPTIHERAMPPGCTFCGKPRKDVRVLVGGPHGQAICNECIALCAEIASAHGPLRPAKKWRRK